MPYISSQVRTGAGPHLPEIWGLDGQKLTKLGLGRSMIPASRHLMRKLMPGAQGGPMVGAQRPYFGRQHLAVLGLGRSMIPALGHLISHPILSKQGSRMVRTQDPHLCGQHLPVSGLGVIMKSLL